MRYVAAIIFFVMSCSLMYSSEFDVSLDKLSLKISIKEKQGWGNKLFLFTDNAPMIEVPYNNLPNNITLPKGTYVWMLLSGPGYININDDDSWESCQVRSNYLNESAVVFIRVNVDYVEEPDDEMAEPDVNADPLDDAHVYIEEGTHQATNITVNNKDYDWFVGQYGTTNGDMNCGPAVAVMACKWYLEDFDMRPEDMRYATDEDPVEGEGVLEWFVVDALDKFKVPAYVIRGEHKYLTETIDEGFIAVARLGYHHYIIVYGYEYRDNGLFFYTKDPARGDLMYKSTDLVTDLTVVIGDTTCDDLAFYRNAYTIGSNAYTYADRN